MYKEASKLKLRIATSKGELSVEQLWDLSLPQLDKVAIHLEEEFEKSGSKSFLVKQSRKDKVTKLRFDVVVDILRTKVEEAEGSVKAQEKKAHNEKILSLIQDKKDADLREMSVEDLEKKLID